MLRRIVSCLFGSAALLLFPAIGAAQYGYNNYSGYSGTGGTSLNQMALKNAQQLLMQSYQPQMSSMSGARIGLGVGQSLSGSKPFSNYSPGPTVSPYLNLFRVDLGGGNNNYSTLVQPQLRQQAINQQQQQVDTQTARRLQSIQAESAYNTQGNQQIYPTGHQTVFNYMGNYYPPIRQRPKKKNIYYN
jgi:hypothetical protein